MIKCKKQFIAFFMAISIVFCVGSESYIKAEAIEWVIPTITAGEAIKWLLGLLGVTVAGVALADTDYEQLAENYTTYAHNQGLTAVETGKFWSDVIDGTLDQGSQAWATFKLWASHLNDVNEGVMSSDFISSLNIVGTLQNDFNTKYAFYSYSTTGYINNVYLVDNNAKLVNIYSGSSLSFGFSSLVQNVPYSYMVLNIDENLHITSQNLSSTTANSININPSRVMSVFCYGMGSQSDLRAIDSKLNEWDFNNTAFNFYNKGLVNDISLILSSAISDAIPDVIPLPWDQVSDAAEGINDKINELIEKVNEGVLSLEDYMIAIQSILGVIAFDTTTDLVIPSDPDLPDETIQDKINENVANNGFVLTGLENFFPFCIPFDIYAFITILVAEPVAPVIHWEIYNPVTHENNEIVLDFAMWESIVVLMRYIFDFLFIIGLALLARSLIGGDD